MGLDLKTKKEYFMRRVLFFILLTSLAFCMGCEPSYGPNPIKFDKSKLVFSADASSETVRCENAYIRLYSLSLTDSDWNEINKKENYTLDESGFCIWVENDWISAKMEGDDVFSVTVKDNDTQKERYAYLSVISVGCDHGGYVKIVQKAK